MRGQGCVADMLVFATLTLIACSILLVSAPRVEVNDAYTKSMARATLQALQHATIDGFGGVAYSPSGLPQRELHHKTFTQLLLEDALLNLGVKVNEVTITPQLNSELNERTERLLQDALERLLGGRFDYEFVAKIDDSGFGFQLVVRSSPRGFDRGWSETATYSLSFGRDAKPVTLEFTLTLWPR